MQAKLYELLEERLLGKQFVAMKISEIEAIGGDDWLLELNEQAMKLSAIAEPHPKDPQLVLVSRQIK